MKLYFQNPSSIFISIQFQQLILKGYKFAVSSDKRSGFKTSKSPRMDLLTENKIQSILSNPESFQWLLFASVRY